MVSNLERDLILQSLRLTGGNKAHAAELLELKRTTFLEKLRRLEIGGAQTHQTAEECRGWPASSIEERPAS